MVSSIFENPLTLRRMREGSIGPHLDGFAGALLAAGYTSLTSQVYLRAAVHFGVWLDARGGALATIDEGTLARFQQHLRACRCGGPNRGKCDGFPTGARHLLSFLRRQGIVGTAKPTPVVPALIAGFETWMTCHRGLARSTLEEGYRLVLRRMLASLGEDPTRYTASDVRNFILDHCTRYGRSNTATSAVRGFLRYLSSLGLGPPHLVDAVPAIARWRLSSLPAYIPASDVTRILDACDTKTADGRRNRAMLLLLARLALRAGDVSGLRITDLDFRAATVAVTGKGRRTSRLPLPQDVGDAILAWLQDGRPARTDPHVFLAVRAPFAPLDSSSVSYVVIRVAARAGVKLPRKGAHVLRHSAATTLLAQGLSLPSIGALLRHRSIESTAIYAKVDLPLLASVAQPWPAEVSP